MDCKQPDKGTSGSKKTGHVQNKRPELIPAMK